MRNDDRLSGPPSAWLPLGFCVPLALSAACRWRTRACAHARTYVRTGRSLGSAFRPRRVRGLSTAGRAGCWRPGKCLRARRERTYVRTSSAIDRACARRFSPSNEPSRSRLRLVVGRLATINQSTERAIRTALAFCENPENARQVKIKIFVTARSLGFGMTYDTRSYICRRRSVDGWLMRRLGKRYCGLPPCASASTTTTAVGLRIGRGCVHARRTHLRTY